MGRIDRTWWRWLLPLVVVAPMVGLGYRLGERAFVFPEGAALAFGVMVVGKYDWVCSRWRLLVLPTACAVAGCVLANLPMPKAAAEVARSGFRVAHDASGQGTARAGGVGGGAAGGVQHYHMDLSGDGCRDLPRTGGNGVAAQVGHLGACTDGRGAAGSVVLADVGAVFVIAVGWIALASLVLPLPAVALAPPLLVAALEWCGHGARPPGAALRRWALLVTAAAVGGAAAWVSPVMGRGIAPTEALAASAVELAAVGVILVILRWTGEYVYPALAMTLVPHLVAPIAPWVYVLAIGIGAAALYGGATVVVCIGRASRYLSAGAVRRAEGFFLDHAVAQGNPPDTPPGSTEKHSAATPMYLRLFQSK